MFRKRFLNSNISMQVRLSANDPVQLLSDLRLDVVILFNEAELDTQKRYVNEVFLCCNN